MRPPSGVTKPLVLRIARGSRRTPASHVLKIKEFRPAPGAEAALPRPPLTALGDILDELRAQWDSKKG